MAIHTLSIGGTSYIIEPKYASSAGYAATAGRSNYAVTANHAVTAGRAGFASSASVANVALNMTVHGNNTSTNYPLLLADSVAVTAGQAKTLYTDTVNSLHYNPSTNLLTAPSFITSALGVSGGVTIYSGSNFNLKASAAAATDPGDIVFSNSSNTELGRLWLDQGSVFKLRYGSSDAAKTIIHEGNISDYLTAQSMKTLKIATDMSSGNYTYTSYDGSSDVTIDMVYGARRAQFASSASYAYQASYASYASSATYASNALTASYAVTAGRAGFASSAGYANYAVTAGMSKATWTNVSTSTFYIAGSTTSTSGSNTLVKNTNVKVQSNAVYASAGFYESSDARLKTITNDVEVDFERLKSIPKIQYIKKGETAPHIGTIAQDLQKVYPEFVETGEDGYMSVDYAKLSIIPLKAVDMLYDEVNKLKDELKIVKEENQMLKDRLDNIEAIINK
jgi:hypothetical protein